MNSIVGRELRYGTLDLNSFFASVEQLLRPELRGRPVAVVPAETDTTCAIAASYEAKAYGVKTGTIIAEAKRLCPELVCVLANHEHYLDYHKLIEAEIDRWAPIIHVGSIDEFTFELPYGQKTLQAARALAQTIKDRIRQQVGVCLGSSVGLSCNRFLSKIASNYQKPDGLTVLFADDVPALLGDYPVEWLTGIGEGMRRRLAAGGITRVAQLYHAEVGRVRALWGSVEGERFWQQLHGQEIARQPTQRRTIGHSHVLAPELRAPEMAFIVMQRLLLKAASRLRKENYFCQAMELSVRFVGGGRAGVGCRFAPCCENFSLLRALRQGWQQLMRGRERICIKKTSVTLHELTAREKWRQLELFSNSEDMHSAASQAKERLCRAMDALNQANGRDTVVQGFTPEQARGFTGTKIAFTRVPDKAEFRQ